MKLVTAREAADIDKILNSELFDAHWYQAQHADVAMLGMLPEYHFYFYGGPLGRPASDAFGPQTHPDIYRAAESACHNPILFFHVVMAESQARSSSLK